MQQSFFLAFVLIWHLIALAHTLIALAHPNCTEKLHLLIYHLDLFDDANRGRIQKSVLGGGGPGY